MVPLRSVLCNCFHCEVCRVMHGFVQFVVFVSFLRRVEFYRKFRLIAPIPKVACEVVRAISSGVTA